MYLVKDKSPDINRKIKNQDMLNLVKNIEWVKILRGNYIVNNKNISEIAFIKKKIIIIFLSIWEIIQQSCMVYD